MYKNHVHKMPVLEIFQEFSQGCIGA